MNFNGYGRVNTNYGVVQITIGHYILVENLDAISINNKSEPLYLEDCLNAKLR